MVCLENSQENVVSILDKIRADLDPPNLIEAKHDQPFYENLATEESSEETVKNKIQGKWRKLNGGILEKAKGLQKSIANLMELAEKELERAKTAAKQSETEHHVNTEEPLVKRTAYEKCIATVMPVVALIGAFVAWNAASQYAIDGLILTQFAESGGSISAYLFSLFPVLAGFAFKSQIAVIQDKARREKLITIIFYTTLGLLVIWIINFSIINLGNNSEEFIYLINPDLAKLLLVSSQISGELLAATLIWLWVDKIDKANRPMVLISSDDYLKALERFEKAKVEKLSLDDLFSTIQGFVKQAEDQCASFVDEGMAHYSAATSRRAARIAAASAPDREDFQPNLKRVK